MIIMAITKIIGAIHPPKTGGRYTSLGRTINYILNPKKTQAGLYTGSVNCNVGSALKDMIATKEYYGKTSSARSERMGYHYTISFSPKERIDYNTAFRIIEEFCQRYFTSEYEAVYALHTDQKHIHGHICFNSVNLQTGYKFRYEDGDWAAKIQPLVDEICKEYGISTLEMDTGRSIEEVASVLQEDDEKRKKWYKKNNPNRNTTKRKRSGYYKEENEPYTKNDFIKHDIDELILLCSSFKEFKKKLQDRGYLIRFGNSEKYGKYMAVKPASFKRYRRTYALGTDYTVDMIKKRIEVKNKPLPVFPDEQDFVFALPVRYLRFSNKTKQENPKSLKLYYAYLYRIGVKPNFKKSNYYENREIIREIRELEECLNLEVEYNISGLEDAEKAVGEIECQIAENESNRHAYFDERKPYNDMIQTYRRYDRLNKEEFLDEKAENERNILYEKLLKYGFSFEDLAAFDARLKGKIKSLNREKRNLQHKKELMIEIKKRYEDENIEEIEKDYERYQDVQKHQQSYDKKSKER